MDTRDIEILISLYKTHTVAQIAVELNITNHQVANKIKTLKKQGLIIPNTRRWTNDEVAFLKLHYNGLSTSEIAKRINRKNTEVTTKAHQLGLKKFIQPIAISEVDEEWKPIPIKSLSHYSVSNYGNIKNSKNLLMQERLNEHGYSIVSLTMQTGKKVVRKIHRLVALAFIPIPNTANKENLTVNHKDFNKQNNHIDNLEWMTRVDNLLHAVENGKNNLIQSNTKATSELVTTICKYIADKKTNLEIVNLLPSNDNLNLADLVSRIRNKRAWVKISKIYF